MWYCETHVILWLHGQAQCSSILHKCVGNMTSKEGKDLYRLHSDGTGKHGITTRSTIFKIKNRIQNKHKGLQMRRTFCWTHKDSSQNQKWHEQHQEHMRSSFWRGESNQEKHQMWATRGALKKIDIQLWLSFWNSCEAGPLDLRDWGALRASSTTI